MQDKLKWFQSTHQWRIYHDEMTERERELWRRAGIPDGVQDMLRLGYARQRPFYANDKQVHCDAMTIPYFQPGWAAATMQYRLVDPPDPNDRYRFQAGLHAPLYLTDPDCTPKGPCILGEGAKKGIVTWLNLGDKLKGCVVASHSKTPKADTLAILADCEPIYIAFDPDATNEQLMAVARLLGLERVRLVQLPVKLDDAFTIHNAAPADIWRFFQSARPAVAA